MALTVLDFDIAVYSMRVGGGVLLTERKTFLVLWRIYYWSFNFLLINKRWSCSEVKWI